MSRKVLIQPSYGNPQARENWAATLAQEVSFIDGALRSALTNDQFSALIKLHPTGVARFWATTGNHDTKMDELASGDVVLFTGNKQLMAIGEIGLLFRNAAAGNALWPPHPDNGAYQNVYSVNNFQNTGIPYAELNKLTATAKSKGPDNYMGARILRGAAADRVIDGLSAATEGDISPQVADAVAAIDELSNPRKKFGRRFTAVENKAIEEHAVQVTRDHFEKTLGYATEDVGQTMSYDVHATKGDQAIKVEVKGTTADGSRVVLTRNEVNLHLHEHPHNALAVVRNISLQRGDPPVAQGGELILLMPWQIDRPGLDPIAYDYRTGI